MTTPKNPTREGETHQPARRTVPGVDPALVGEPVETDDGSTRRPVQQNVGYGVEEGSGEWPDPAAPPHPGARGSD